MTISGVIKAGCVVPERFVAICRVAVAGCVQIERPTTSGRVTLAGCVECERANTVGRVVDARCVAGERTKTNACIAGARCEAEKGVITFSGIVIWVASVRWWAQLRSGRREKRKASEHEGDKKKAAPQERPAD